jgi:AmmeMemoRadiSam system protein A
MGSTPLTSDEKRTLLRVARSAVVHRTRSEAKPTLADLDSPVITERLATPQGAFVTIEKRGELRGCIGLLHPLMPLWETVAENAIRAGWGDPRFDSLRVEEIPLIDIEVTTIESMEPITEPSEIEIGTHGLLIEAQGQRGVLLPQVASERRWDAQQFLGAVCRKAGLAPDAWRSPGASLWRFSAEHFSEQSEHVTPSPRGR